MAAHPTPTPRLQREPVRLIVVDAHHPSRIGLAMMLSQQAWVDDCVSAADAGTAVEIVRREGATVAIVELTPFAASAVERLRDADPAIRIVLSARCPASMKLAERRLGADAVIELNTSPDEALEAIRVVASGAGRIKLPAPRTVSERDLSEREREVLALIVIGATNAEIAAELHLGRESIKKYATSIYRKFGVRNRTELARRVAERSILAADGRARST